MKKIVLLGALALGLSGCVTDRKVSDYICTHQIAVTASANAALSAAATIKDPLARQIATDNANATLALVAACPPLS